MEHASGAMIAAEDLGKSFGGRRAVAGVSLAVSAGEALAVFGPNGAGKTTTLRMLGGLLRPTEGRARIAGTWLPGGPDVRRRVGLISHNTLLYDALTARENVEFAAKLYRVADPPVAATRALARMGISDHAGVPVRSLSRGMKQRVAVARATVHDPAVVLADEPYTGLDVAGAAALTSVLAELRRAGACVVLVTHNIEEGLALASHVAVMDRGKLVLQRDRSGVDAAAFAGEYQRLVAPGV